MSNVTALKVSLGIFACLDILLVGIFCLYCGMKRRKFRRLQDKYFRDNGGVLLQNELMADYRNGAAKIFTREELKTATNNFHDSGKLSEGAYGFVYKGILPDKTAIAIKVPKSSAPITSSEPEQFINQVIVLSQINHRNVVKLLGCCLETQTPLLVYEFVANGTLYEHIHRNVGRSTLSLEVRMKIAAEVARALAFIHLSTPSIIHRDVKTSKILLDGDYTAKLSGFGGSIILADDQDQLEDLVQGTMGYLDPEYFKSNSITAKSDVYSFGVILTELLTSRVAISFEMPVAERNLANLFVTSMEEGCLDQILDHEIVNEKNYETVRKVAELAERCLRLRGDERPSIGEVLTELEGLQFVARLPVSAN